MQPQASTAERAIPQTPFAEVQEMITYVRAQGETSVMQNHGRPNVVDPDQPSLLSKDESPFGVPVRLGVNNEGTQTRNSFYVLDIRQLTAMRRSDGQVVRTLGNGIAVVTGQSATHLLINRYFDGSDEPVPGYQGLGPGESIEISRANEVEDARKIMMERFGIFPIVASGYSRKRHAKVSLGDDGASISVIDLGSTRGNTFVTTRKTLEAEPTPDRVGKGRRVARALLGNGGAQTTNGYGQEL